MDLPQEETSSEITKVNNNRSGASSIQGIIETGGKASALFLGLIYICGFLTLNSHFYKYGIVDIGIASSDYLVAGSIFILYVVTYGLFGGRAIVLMKTWMGQHIDRLVESGSPRIAPLIAFIHSYVELAFFHCLSAAIFSTYAFGQYESFRFYAALSIAFLISYTMDITNFDIKRPFANIIIDLVIKVVAILSFFALSSSFKPILIFISFMLFSFYINMVLDQFERYRVNRDRVIFTIIYSAIFFLGSAVSFGAIVYGDVSKKIGGGKSIPMEIGINREYLGSLAKEYENSILGDVVYTSSENIYLKVKNETIVLPRASVQWMRFQAPEEKNIMEKLGIVPEKEINGSNETNEPNKRTNGVKEQMGSSLL